MVQAQRTSANPSKRMIVERAWSVELFPISAGWFTHIEPHQTSPQHIRVARARCVELCRARLLCGVASTNHTARLVARPPWILHSTSDPPLFCISSCCASDPACASFFRTQKLLLACTEVSPELILQLVAEGVYTLHTQLLACTAVTTA